MKRYTTESVLRGHPDKVCDQISDAILDVCLAKNKYAHTAIECLGTGNEIVVSGEIDGVESIELSSIINSSYQSIGYNNKINVRNLLRCQSAQLKKGLLLGGAGDQGVMYGYAINNKYNFLPYGVYLSNSIARNIDNFRINTDYLLPDGKVQVTMTENSIETIIINVQNTGTVEHAFLVQEIIGNVLSPLVDCQKVNIEINKKSKFLSGGIENDTGVTGRKIIADTYGGLICHGGGAFSGKDPTKMDRSASYMARYVAKNIVANGFADECKIALAYAFGEEYPVMVQVETEKGYADKKLIDFINKQFDFRPEAIIERLGLRECLYLPTAVYSHFSNPTFPWEIIESL